MHNNNAVQVHGILQPAPGYHFFLIYELINKEKCISCGNKVKHFEHTNVDSYHNNNINIFEHQ